MKVFTLGTAGRQHFEFTKLLNKYGIQVVLDIRRSPASPQAPQFNRDSLQMLCASQRAEYIYLGNDFAGGQEAELRPNQLDPDDGRDRMTVKDWQASDGFQRVLKIVAAKAATRVTCILCTERNPDDCHRLFLANELARSGLETVHVLAESVLWTPGPARRRPARPRRPEREPGHGLRGPRRPRPPRHDRPDR
jgi:uncharacterized protein (DUF488 family)